MEIHALTHRFAQQLADGKARLPPRIPFGNEIPGALGGHVHQP
jgi:hypothetical protein